MKVAGSRLRTTAIGGYLAALLFAFTSCALPAREDSFPPAFAEVVARYRPSDIRLLDRNGEVLHETRVDDRARRLAWVALADVSPALVASIVRAEDRRFYAHGGVDPYALAGAVWQRTRGGRRGASTISMQVAALLATDVEGSSSGRRSWRSKWRQMRLAWALESRWSKREILEAYLNLVTYRGEIQGIGAAAQVLFHKRPHGLDGAEAAVLAAAVRAPNASRASLTRRARALAPDTEGVDDAVARVVSLAAGPGPRVALAPHLAGLVRRTASAAHQGRDFSVPDFSVTTTLDAELQRVASDSLRRHLLALAHRRVRDGAVLAVDNRSGAVLAYVGSSGRLSSASAVDGVRALRQAGSTLKPFLYAAAIDARLLTASSPLADTPLEISVGSAVYRPQNYDDDFRGLISLRLALAGSVNVPAVRALQLFGVDRFAELLRRVGMASVRRSGEYYGPSLALGSADVSLWELVTAYRTLANHGRYSQLSPVPTQAGATVRAISPPAAFIVSDILADRESRSATFGLENPLATPFWTAVKTGTSKDMRDNWCIGSSRDFTVGVWVGNFSGAPMGNVSGISGAAPVWLDVMRWLHRERPSLPPPPPEGVVRVAGEWYLAGTEPSAETSERMIETETAPRIAEPAAGTSFAIDPDIPLAQQAIRFAVDGDERDLRWQIDDVEIGAVTAQHRWAPVAGHHRLRLLDRSGRELDELEFVVR